ncbi:IS66 family insertion sequence element accessory protein TnpA [Photorhabdus laumondii]|uniref:IS66 family insertion sequence element accessory protein TnpA n=1 Tax=Photorhabdus laumondii TaxID=2218628 RepID=UPI001F1CAAB3|nr:hypothetical protein [Photorhabdus laumondii]
MKKWLEIGIVVISVGRLELASRQQHWAAVIEVQKQSGLMVTAFCQHREINLATFYYWAKKLRQQREPQRLHPVVPPDTPSRSAAQ